MTYSDKSSRIPRFKSLEEEAAFWDTHDMTDFAGELTPVEVSAAQHLSDVVTVPFDPEVAEALRRAAAAEGVEAPALIQTWVNERLKETERA